MYELAGGVGERAQVGAAIAATFRSGKTQQEPLGISYPRPPPPSRRCYRGVLTHPDLSGFPLIVAIPLQWGDLDAFGHVNNLTYLRWCESARVEYMMRVGAWLESPQLGGIGPILASVSCDYRVPLNYPDTIQVSARVTRIGNTSLRMEHRIVSQTLHAVAAEAHSTIVMVDYATKKPVAVPPAVREAIARFEGRTFSQPPLASISGSESR